MKRGTTLFLKLTVFMMGLAILALSLFWLPWQAEEAAKMAPEFAYLQYPVLIGLYVTALPFLWALFQAFQLLRHIDRNNAFSALSIRSLAIIHHCAVVICILYIAGCLTLISQNALHPGIALIAAAIMFASFVIAVFAAVLKKLLASAIQIKIENDLIV